MFLGVIVLVVWPAEPQAGFHASVPSIPDQEERALHLQLAQIYERNGSQDKALEEYQKAMSAGSDEYSAAARAGIERILSRQSSPWLRLRETGRSFLFWSAENVLRVMILAVIVYGVWLLVGLFSHHTGYLLEPFDDFEDGKLGIALSVGIDRTIHQARSIHLDGQKGIFAVSENLFVPIFGTLGREHEEVAESLKAIDSFVVGLISLPWIPFLTMIHKWGSRREHMIHGRIDKIGALMRLTVHVTRRGKGIVQTWALSKTIKNDVADPVLQMEEEIAYQILYYMCPQVEAQSWQSLMLFSKALNEMQKYRTRVGGSDVLEEAAKLLEECLIIDPSYPLAKFNLGLVYSTVGKHDQAIGIFKEIKEFEKSFQVETIYNLGLSYYHKFQDWAYDLAVREFKEVLHLLGNETKNRDARTLLALAHCGLSAVYAQKVMRESKKADEYFVLSTHHHDQALRLAEMVHDVQAVAHSALGLLYMNSGKIEEAVDAFMIAVRLKRDYLINYVYLADIYSQKGDYQRTIQWLLQAIRYNPHYEYAQYRLGMAYKALGEIEMAMTAWYQAPNIADAHNELGKILASQERYKEALDEFHQAHTLNSRHSEVLCNLAWYTIEADITNDEALQQITGYARQSLQIEQGTNYEWHRRAVLAWVYLNRNMKDEAERELITSIQNNPQKTQNRYHLALVFQAKSENEKAKQTLIALFNDTSEKGVWRDKAEALLKDLKKDNHLK